MCCTSTSTSFILIQRKIKRSPALVGRFKQPTTAVSVPGSGVSSRPGEQGIGAKARVDCAVTGEAYDAKPNEATPVGVSLRQPTTLTGGPGRSGKELLGKTSEGVAPPGRRASRFFFRWHNYAFKKVRTLGKGLGFLISSSSLL